MLGQAVHALEASFEQAMFQHNAKQLLGHAQVRSVLQRGILLQTGAAWHGRLLVAAGLYACACWHHRSSAPAAHSLCCASTGRTCCPPRWLPRCCSGLPRAACHCADHRSSLQSLFVGQLNDVLKQALDCRRCCASTGRTCCPRHWLPRCCAGLLSRLSGWPSLQVCVSSPLGLQLMGHTRAQTASNNHQNAAACARTCSCQASGVWRLLDPRRNKQAAQISGICAARRCRLSLRAPCGQH